MNIPKKISPSPILEAVVEIRFENELPSEVIFGKLYGALSTEFDQTEQLPILQMPAQFREMQPELKYAPHYRLKNDKFIVNIGQRTVSVNRICTEHEYKNWAEFSKVINKVFAEVKNIGFVSVADRVSVRYINFIQKDIREVLNLEIGLFKTKVEDFKELNLAFMKQQDSGTMLNIGIAINAKVDISGITQEGLVVNIEAFNEKATDIGGLSGVINKLHSEAEKGFFNALDTEFLSSLNPVYE